MSYRLLAAGAVGLLTALVSAGSAGATVALSGALNSHATAALNEQVNTDTQSDGWKKKPHDLMVVAGSAAINGDDFASVQDAISAHWKSASSGSVTLLDHGWVTDVTHGRETSVSADLSSPTTQPAWTYAFQATGDGSFDLGFDLTGTGQTGGLGLWDVVFSEDGGPGQLSTLTRTFPQADFHVANPDAFSHVLEAGHHYSVSLITDEGFFDSLLDPGRREAAETGGFTWSISGGGAEGAGGGGTGVPEPSTWALSILGFGLAGAALRRRARPAMIA